MAICPSPFEKCTIYFSSFLLGFRITFLSEVFRYFFFLLKFQTEMEGIKKKELSLVGLKTNSDNPEACFGNYSYPIYPEEDPICFRIQRK